MVRIFFTPYMIFLLTAVSLSGIFTSSASLCSSSESTTSEKEFLIYINIESPLQDIVTRRLEEAFERIGERVRIIWVESSERALLLANQQGDGDALRLPAIKNIAPHLTKNLIRIPEPIALIELSAFTRESSHTIDGWDSLNEKRSGARIGMKIAQKNLPPASTFLPDSDRLFQMLNAGRLDVVVEHTLIGESYLQKEEYSSLRKQTPPLVSVPSHTFLHKKNIRLVDRLSQALQEMKKDGSYDQIQDTILNGQTMK